MVQVAQLQPRDDLQTHHACAVMMSHGKHMVLCNAGSNKLTKVHIWRLARPEPAVSHVGTLFHKIPADIKNTTIVSGDRGSKVSITQSLQAIEDILLNNKYAHENANKAHGLQHCWE